MKTLIIWQVIPEDVKYYIHPSLTDEGLATVKLCHGHLVNLENSPEVDDALNELQEEISNPDSAFVELQSEDMCKCKPDFICVTGFCL